MSEDVDPFNLSNRSRKKQSSFISPRAIIKYLIAVWLPFANGEIIENCDINHMKINKQFMNLLLVSYPCCHMTWIYNYN